MTSLRYYEIALQVSKLSTCQDSQVGAILVSGSGDVLAAGFNRAVSASIKCDDKGCKIHRKRSCGTLHTECSVEHAEYNVIKLFRQHSNRFYAPPCSTMVITRSPCFACCLIIRDFRIRNVVYQGEPVRADLFPSIKFTQLGK